MKKLKKYTQNENGGALIYALLISVLIITFVPIIYQMNNMSALQASRSKETKLVHHVAVSSIETLVAYLKAIPINSNRITHFNNYTGWGQRTLPTAEGSTIDYKLYLVGTDPANVTSSYKPQIPLTQPGRYKVVAQATIGNITKQIVYGFDVKNLSGGDVAPGGISSYNQLINFINGTNPYDTNNDRVIAWKEIEAATAEKTFNEFFVNLRNDLTGGTFDYSFNDPVSMINFMRTNQALKLRTGQISIACNCSQFDLSTVVAKNTSLDFVTGYNASAFVVYFSNSVSQNAGNWNLLWRMRGMIMVNGNLTLNDRVFDISNIVVNGVFTPSSGSKQGAFLATNSYTTASSTNPSGTSDTVTYFTNYISTGGSSAWAPAPGQ
jgi:hypothetical protein